MLCTVHTTEEILYTFFTYSFGKLYRYHISITFKVASAAVGDLPRPHRFFIDIIVWSVGPFRSGPVVSIHFVHYLFIQLPTTVSIFLCYVGLEYDVRRTLFLRINVASLCMLAI